MPKCIACSSARSVARAAGLLALLLLAAPASAADLPSEAAPHGIAPTAVALGTVLDGHRRAIGRPGLGLAPTRVEHWKTTFGSLSGTRDAWRNGSDYRVDEVLGPDRTGWGTLGGRRWQLNANGQISFGRDLHRSDDVNNRSMRSSAHLGVTLLGEVSGPPPAYVVKVAPPGGRLQYVFYDKATFLIDRVEEIRDGRRVSVTYADYRATAGITEAWHVHSSDGFDSNDHDETLLSLRVGEPVTAADLAIPTGGPPLVRVATSQAEIPVTIVDDRIVVRTRIGGHGVDFLLDSGADGIVVDKDVVAALGIKQYGRITSETAGTYVESAVVLPSVKAGPLSMTDVHAVSLPFLQFTSTGTPIAGLLGYDFIAGLVWHVDYQHGTVAALDPATFTPPAGASAFAVTFEDRVPTLKATIAGVNATALIVDTGADRCTLFSPFTNAHAGKILDEGLGLEMQAASPFVDDFFGVGGSVDYRPLQAGPFVFGPWTFPKWLFFVTQDAPSFEFEDYDGLVGQDFLRNFDLYLDYPHSKIYLVPNDRFRQRWS